MKGSQPTLLLQEAVSACPTVIRPGDNYAGQRSGLDELDDSTGKGVTGDIKRAGIIIRVNDSVERFTVSVETRQMRGALDFGMGGGEGGDLICLDFQRSCEVEETRTRWL